MIELLRYSFRMSLQGRGSDGQIFLIQTGSRKKKYRLDCTASGIPVLLAAPSVKEAGQFQQNWTIDLSHAQAQTILKLCEGIVVSVKAAEPEIFGLDGWRFELELCSDMNSVTFAWWCDLPEEWQSLENLVNVLNSLVARVIPGAEWVLKPE